MPVSDFTRRICQQLCLERAIDMEIARLGEKGRILEERGALTPSEAARDAERRAEARRLIEIAAQPITPSTGEDR